MSNQLPPRPVVVRAERRPSDILATIGFIIIGIVIIWGLVHAAQLASPWFSSLFPEKNSAVVVSAPESATSGTPFTISWKYSPSVAGHYVFLFPCNSGILFKTDAAGGGTTNIPCGAGFSVPTGDKTLTLTPLAASAKSDTVNVPLSIIFIPANASAHVGGSDTIAIVSAKNPEVTPIVKTTPAAPAKKAHVTTSSLQTGPADLSVRVISITADPYGNGMIEFDIANIGSGPTGTWYFEVNLPTQSGQGYTYVSPAQKSLAPNDHIDNTLQFSQLSSNGGMISIQVDPANTVYETNESNNFVSQPIGVTYVPPQYTY